MKKWAKQAKAFPVPLATCQNQKIQQGHCRAQSKCTLRPNEKMIHQLMYGSHGLQFSIDALADPNSKMNFHKAPTKDLFEWAKQNLGGDQ